MRPVFRLAQNAEGDDPIKDVVYKNKGFMTVEASLVMPAAIMCFFIILYGLILSLDTEMVRADIYSVIYSVPVLNGERYVEEAANGGNIGKDIIWGDVSSETDGAAAIRADIDLRGVHTVTGSTEYDLCTARLRRWQLYGNLADE